MSGYIPDPDDVTQPTVSRPAQSAAAEFRALKSKINSLPSAIASFDPSDTGSFITLSGGNLIATVNLSSGVPPSTPPYGANLTRGNLGMHDNKTYFEITILQSSRSIFIGVQTLLNDLVHAPGIGAGTGQSVNNSGTSYAPDANTFSDTFPFIAGDVIGVAVDVLGGSISFYKNGTLLETKTGITFGAAGLAVYPVVALSGFEDAVLANFGQSAFAFSPPGGYSGFGSIFNYVSGIRNVIVNGRCDIDQRNGGVVQNNIANGTYMTDHWRYNASVANKFNAQQNAGVSAPANYNNSQGLVVAAAYTPAINETFNVSQFIEGSLFAHLDYGKASAKTCSLIFYARSSVVGVHSGALTNAAFNRSYSFTFTITTANTWHRFAIVIPGDTTGTWVTFTTAKAAILRFNLGSGSDFLDTAGAWVAANRVGVTSAALIVTNAAATFNFTGVEFKDGIFVAGSEPELIPFFLEQEHCYRYYRAASCFVPTAGTFQASFMFSPAMRDVPTITGAGPGFVTPAISAQLVQMEQTVASSQNLVFDAEMV